MSSREVVGGDARLEDTRRAFDRAAPDYDGPAGNNLLIQRMRACMWQTVIASFPPGARLLDLGCGTGIDASYLADHGYSVLAIDWSPAMVKRTQDAIAAHGLERRATARLLGIHELCRLRGEQFDGIYSNLGALNCVPDLRGASAACSALLRPGGRIVVSVIGRVCPWEVAYYLALADPRRAFLRFSRSAVAVPLNGETVWTWYYTPREFYRAFAHDFELSFYRGLRLCSPPPYMLGAYRRLSSLCTLADRMDDRVGALPVLRNAGDHFLMVMTRRE